MIRSNDPKRREIMHALCSMAGIRQPQTQDVPLHHVDAEAKTLRTLSSVDVKENMNNLNEPRETLSKIILHCIKTLSKHAVH